MSRNTNAKAKELLELAARYGFALHRHRRHLIVRDAEGRQTSIPGTTGSWRTYRNTEAILRRLVRQPPPGA